MQIAEVVGRMRPESAGVADQPHARATELGRSQDLEELLELRIGLADPAAATDAGIERIGDRHHQIVLRARGGLLIAVAKQLIGKVYVEEKRRKWAPHWSWTPDGSKCVPPEGVNPATDPHSNPYGKSKVLGLFPETTSADGLIPISWVKSAQLRNLSATIKDGPNELGADIGAGGDSTAICHREGYVFRIIRSDNDPDTMSQCGKIIEDLRRTKADCVKIDKIGIGWGVVNRGQELGKPFIGVNVGEGATEDDENSDDRFLNLKAELWWNVRDLFERGLIDIDPADDDLAAELLSVRFERRSNGKIKIMDKKRDANGKKIASPNRAESLMLAAAPSKLVGQLMQEIEVLWG